MAERGKDVEACDFLLEELNAAARSIATGEVALEKAVSAWMSKNRAAWKSWRSASGNWKNRDVP
ncbi:MAG: hypothetical protein ACR2PG_14435 [Hyphomicrobiaceae bacterium]